MVVAVFRRWYVRCLSAAICSAVALAYRRSACCRSLRSRRCVAVQCVHLLHCFRGAYVRWRCLCDRCGAVRCSGRPVQPYAQPYKHVRVVVRRGTELAYKSSRIGNWSQKTARARLAGHQHYCARHASCYSLRHNWSAFLKAFTHGPQRLAAISTWIQARQF